MVVVNHGLSTVGLLALATYVTAAVLDALRAGATGVSILDHVFNTAVTRTATRSGAAVAVVAITLLLLAPALPPLLPAAHASEAPVRHVSPAVAECRAAAAQEEAALVQLGETVLAAQRRIAELEHDIHVKSQTPCAAMGAACAESETGVAALEAHVSSLRARVEALQGDLSTVQSKGIAAQAMLRSEQAATAALEAEAASLPAAHAASTDEDLDRAAAVASRDAAALAAQRDRAQEHVAQLHDQLDAVHTVSLAGAAAEIATTLHARIVAPLGSAAARLWRKHVQPLVDQHAAPHWEALATTLRLYWSSMLCED